MTIEGYGRATQKAIIHALEKAEDGESYVTLCSKIPMILDPDLNIMQVSCGNCKRLKAYADKIQETIDQPIEKKQEKPSQKKKSKDTSTVIVDTDKSEVIDINLDFDPKTIKNDLPKLREVFFNRLANLEQQFIGVSRENGTYDITHRLSDIVFFGPVQRMHLTSCLLMLNSSKEQWTGRNSPKQEWIDNIKKLFSAGYSFAQDMMYLESEAILEKEKENAILRQETEGLRSHNDLLIEEQQSLKKDILSLHDKLKKVQELAIEQQLEINDLKVSKTSEKAEKKERPKIKRLEIKDKPRPKIKRLKI